MTDLTQSLRLEMERFLAQFAGEKVLLIPNEGNAGDCLILASTLTAMAKASIDVEVVDNGVGINPEDVAKIYDPFFTTKGVGRGTGLGLAVTYGIVQEHSGHISVNSTPGLGTTFRITLPTRDPHTRLQAAAL